MAYLRPLDALDLEVAMRLDASSILTFDRRLGEAAGSARLDVITPGALSGGPEMGELADLIGQRDYSVTPRLGPDR